MRRFRRFFAVLFVASTLLGALHEVLHDHRQDMEGHYEHSCPLYLLTQTPAVPTEPFTLTGVERVNETFATADASFPLPRFIALRTRSPPFA
ncbi:MAG: hypothetical protein JXK04_08610 [Campylobacterales bacterium]|nr:hypothetical protein [Campylobacterales bacterium]